MFRKMSEALTFQLVEGHLKKVKIFEGQMKRPTFRIKFKGNNPNYGANIIENNIEKFHCF